MIIKPSLIFNSDYFIALDCYAVPQLKKREIKCAGSEVHYLSEFCNQYKNTIKDHILNRFIRSLLMLRIWSQIFLLMLSSAVIKEKLAISAFMRGK